MKTSLLWFGIALSIIALAANKSEAQQQLGAQVRTKQTFGYGKLVMAVKPSTEKGIINGFFMLKINPVLSDPQGSAEIDYEYVPGNNNKDRSAGRRITEGNCGPNGQGCVIGKLGSQSAADFISVNIVAGPGRGGSQVFYKLGSAYFEAVKTYTIEWTPDQVRWSASGVNNDQPFMYQQSGTNYNDIHVSPGFEYLVGRQMHIYLNCYSGLGYPGSFGGTDVIPRNNTEMVVEKVEFYPLSGGEFSTVPVMSSDFKNGRYTLLNAASSFDAIWLNKDVTDFPIFTRAANASVVPGKGLVLTYTFRP